MDEGDHPLTDGQWAGTQGVGHWLEGLQLSLVSPPDGLHIGYSAWLAGTAGTPVYFDGEYCGTSGNSQRLEGFHVRIDGPLASEYDVKYRAMVAYHPYPMPISQDDQLCGIIGQGIGCESVNIWIEKLPDIEYTAKPATALIVSHDGGGRDQVRLDSNEKTLVEDLRGHIGGWNQYWYGEERLKALIRDGSLKPKPDPSNANPTVTAAPGAFADPNNINADGQNIRTVEQYLSAEASLAFGSSVRIISGFRRNSEAHVRGSVDIQVPISDTVITMLSKAMGLANRLGPHTTVIAEQLFDDGFQVNSAFKPGNKVQPQHFGPNHGPDPQLHASVTHIHVQADKQFTLPPDAAAVIQKTNFSGCHDIVGPAPSMQPRNGANPSQNGGSGRTVQPGQGATHGETNSGSGGDNPGTKGGGGGDTGGSSGNTGGGRDSGGGGGNEPVIKPGPLG